MSNKKWLGAIVGVVITATAMSSVMAASASVGGNKIDRSIVLDGQRTITVTLPSNPGSTGYDLYLVGVNRQLLKPIGSRFIAAPMHDADGNMIVGRPGVREFTFAVKSAFYQVPQETTLKFASMRTWDPENNAQPITIDVYSPARSSMGEIQHFSSHGHTKQVATVLNKPHKLNDEKRSNNK